MLPSTRRSALKLLAGGGAAALLGQPGMLHAQEAYPSRPVRIIVPFGPGGGSDEFARRFARLIGGGIGERAIVENRAGGNTLVATQAVAQARPDGYTILQQTNNFTVNPYLHKDLGFDTLKDFIPISLVARLPHVLIVNNDLPAKNVQELLTLARANPGKLNFGSAGIGTTNHLAAEMFNKIGGVKIEHVPYRSAMEYTNDLIAGRIQLVFGGGAQAIAQARGGTVRALGVTSKTRASDIPDVPTIEEAGMPGYEIYSWFGYLVPAGTPEPIVAKLTQEIRAAALDPRTREQIPSIEFVGSTPAEFAKFLKDDLALMGDLLKHLGTVKVD